MRLLEMWWIYCHNLVSLNKLGSTTVSSCFVHMHGFSILVVSGQGEITINGREMHLQILNVLYIEGVVSPLLRNNIFY